MKWASPLPHDSWRPAILPHKCKWCGDWLWLEMGWRRLWENLTRSWFCRECAMDASLKNVRVTR